MRYNSNKLSWSIILWPLRNLFAALRSSVLSMRRSSKIMITYGSQRSTLSKRNHHLNESVLTQADHGKNEKEMNMHLWIFGDSWGILGLLTPCKPSGHKNRCLQRLHVAEKVTETRSPRLNSKITSFTYANKLGRLFLETTTGRRTKFKILLVFKLTATK